MSGAGAGWGRVVCAELRGGWCVLAPPLAHPPLPCPGRPAPMDAEKPEDEEVDEEEEEEEEDDDDDEEEYQEVRGGGEGCVRV